MRSGERFGCAVVVVHHCGIEGTRPRGHTSLTAAADAQIAVKRERGDIIGGPMPWSSRRMARKERQSTAAWRSPDVGLDDDAELITSCIIVLADGVEPRGGRSVTGAAKVALDLLRRAIEENGGTAPAGPHFPPHCKVVSVGLWQSYCDTGTISESDKLDSKEAGVCPRFEKVARAWFDWCLGGPSLAFRAAADKSDNSRTGGTQSAQSVRTDTDTPLIRCPVVRLSDGQRARASRSLHQRGGVGIASG